MKSLFQTRKLSTIYPDITGQLCNKHVKRLSKLKTVFKNIYVDMEPQGYVLVNGMAKVIDLGQDLHLSFALENGVTVLYSKTYLNEDIFINGNHMKLELIFNSKGQHEDGIHQKIDQIKNLMNLIRKRSGQQKEFYGGIIYLHSNISENLFGFQQCVMTGLALALLLVHEEISKYTQEALVELLCQADSKLSKRMISNLIQQYKLNSMVAQTTFTQQKIQQKEVQFKRMRPRARTEITDRPIFGQIMSQCIDIDVPSCSQNQQKSFQKSHQFMKQNVGSMKENFNQSMKLSIPSSNPSPVSTEKSIFDENRSQCFKINIVDPCLNSDKSIFSQLSSQSNSIRINILSPSQDKDGQFNVTTVKSIMEQIPGQCFNPNLLSPQTYKSIFDQIYNQCPKSNLLNSSINSDKSFSTELNSIHLKKSVNSMRTAEDEFVVENNLDNDESSSGFGSLQKIQNYPSQELRSLHVSLKDTQKLVFCKLDISKGQEYDFSSKMDSISKINEFIQEQGICRNQLINQNGQVKLPKELKDVVGQDQNLVEYCQQMKNILILLASKSIQFQKFVKLKYELDRKYHIYDGQVDQILSKLQASNRFIQNFCIIEGAVLLISMDKLYYAEMMIFLRKLLKESKLSTEKYIATSQKIEDDQKYNDISETMFTAMPSAGYAIYKPAEQENFWI